MVVGRGRDAISGHIFAAKIRLEGTHERGTDSLTSPVAPDADVEFCGVPLVVHVRRV
jgi:hypothetical protein